MLPGREEIEPLVGGRQATAVLEAAPERLRRRHVVEHLDARDLVGAPHGCGRPLLSAGVVADGDVHPVCAAGEAWTPIFAI